MELKCIDMNYKLKIIMKVILEVSLGADKKTFDFIGDY